MVCGLSSAIAGPPGFHKISYDFKGLIRAPQPSPSPQQHLERPARQVLPGRAAACRLHCAATVAPYSNWAENLTSDMQERGGAAARMFNSLETEGRPQDTRVVVAMSGGVDS